MRRITFTCLALVAVILFTTRCSALPFGQTTASPTPGTNTPSSITQAQQATATPARTMEPGIGVLRLWLPAEFDPDSGTPEGELLKARLDEYRALRPGVMVEVRIKSVDGPGGMLDSLNTASAAAPLALPDLIALPRPLFEEAALKGLLRPAGELAEVLEDPDWYEYARQIAQLQDSAFGLPFAGDAMLVVYRTERLAEGLATWEAALQSSTMLAFPASDPRALFTLALYLSSGGRIQDEQGRPMLDPAKLTEVFTFYQQAESSGLMPYWLTQYETDSQAWSAFSEAQAYSVVTWASSYLNLDPGAPLSAAVLPTQSGQPFTLATGWVWALASPHPEKHLQAIELAEFLTAAEFLARWTEAAGYLPPRASALEAWGDDPAKVLAGQLSLSAQIIPTADLLASVAPPLREATISILKEQGDPAALAEAAAAGLASP